MLAQTNSEYSPPLLCLRSLSLRYHQLCLRIRVPPKEHDVFHCPWHTCAACGISEENALKVSQEGEVEGEVEGECEGERVHTKQCMF